MPKAEINTANGTKITIEGTVEEVKTIVNSFGHASPPPRNSPQREHFADKRLATPSGPKARIRTLKDKDFFASPKTISDVKSKLATEGHIYAVTSLSGPLLDLTREGVLRRVKDETGNWTYVNP